MELYLQMGHGMKEMSKNLIKLWGSGRVILSPLNMPYDRLCIFSKEIHEINGSVLFDPQMFFKNENSKKIDYDYWNNIETLDSNNICSVCRELIAINDAINSDYFIIPSCFITAFNVKEVYSLMTQSASFCRNSTTRPLLMTLCISHEVIKDDTLLERIIESMNKVDVDGYYVIVQPCNGSYLNTDLMWEINYLKLLTCLKLEKRKVIVGYSNHQSLIAALAKVDGIASGNFANTRSFESSRFLEGGFEETRRRASWYYLPEAFTEYKSILLDIAYSRNFLDYFKPAPSYMNDYCSVLFSGAKPSSTNYNETSSFYHYLCCLKKQCEELTCNSYLETFSKYNFLLLSAETRIEYIRNKGIDGQNRSFSDSLNVNKIAIGIQKNDYQIKLMVEWPKM